MYMQLKSPFSVIELGLIAVEEAEACRDGSVRNDSKTVRLA
jgi:hypothetical protein